MAGEGMEKYWLLQQQHAKSGTLLVTRFEAKLPSSSSILS